MHAGERMVEMLHAIKKLGVHIAVDDFGTGYSSLSYLKRFPVDRLKVDRSFVQHMADADDAVIVRAIIALGHNLGLEGGRRRRRNRGADRVPARERLRRAAGLLLLEARLRVADDEAARGAMRRAQRRRIAHQRAMFSKLCSATAT